MPDTNPPHPDGSPDEESLREEFPVLPRRARYHDVQDEIDPATISRSSPERQEAALALAKVCARIAQENRARDVVLLDLRQSTPLFDYFVVITAPSRRQLNAIISEIDHEMKQRKEFKLGIEGSDEGRWTLIDYGDFVVHVFSEDAREFYSIEDIWGDAPRIEWDEEKESPPSPPAPDQPTN